MEDVNANFKHFLHIFVVSENVSITCPRRQQQSSIALRVSIYFLPPYPSKLQRYFYQLISKWEGRRYFEWSFFTASHGSFTVNKDQ